MAAKAPSMSFDWRFGLAEAKWNKPNIKLARDSPLPSTPMKEDLYYHTAETIMYANMAGWPSSISEASWSRHILRMVQSKMNKQRWINTGFREDQVQLPPNTHRLYEIHRYATSAPIADNVTARLSDEEKSRVTTTLSELITQFPDIEIYVNYYFLVTGDEDTVVQMVQMDAFVKRASYGLARRCFYATPRQVEMIHREYEKFLVQVKQLCGSGLPHSRL
ncbi:hypothetical protein DICA3_E13960 [Diutina catenulata]